jgi:acyl-CoA thioester hydrolase
MLAITNRVLTPRKPGILLARREPHDRSEIAAQRNRERFCLEHECHLINERSKNLRSFGPRPVLGPLRCLRRSSCRIQAAGPAPAAGAKRRILALAQKTASVQDNWVLDMRNKGNRAVTVSLDGEIRDGLHYMQVRVYFEDTDAGQIVYHANFLRFMERGRTNYLRLLGTNQQALLEETRNDAPGFAFVVRSMTIDFLKPAVLDDLLDIVTVPQEVRGASIGLLQECRRGDDLLVSARVRVAFILGGKAQRIPKGLRLALEKHR